MELARRRGAEIISVDSMQVYRKMDIGTAKPTALERAEVTHHLIDVAEPEEEFSVSAFREMGRKVMSETETELLVSGGSGLHFRALVDPMSFAPTEGSLRNELEETPLEDLVRELLSIDAEAAHHVDIANKRRVVRAIEICQLGGGTPTERYRTAEANRIRRYEAEVPFVGIGIDPSSELTDRIDARLREMRAGGLVDEVKRLASRLGRTARAAVGYREILSFLEGKTDIEAAFASIATNTNRLARRQRTWFQRDPRIQWIPWSPDPTELADRAEEVIE